jgi:hypothetical protein
MARKVLWRSWCQAEAKYETDRIRKLDTTYEWVDGHQYQPSKGDIYLTGNGYDYKDGPFKKVSLYAESFIYLKNEYVNWQNNRKWDYRFHFNPNYADFPRCGLHRIGCWWLDELDTYHRLRKEAKQDFVFGMVLGDKGASRQGPDFNYMRHEVVKHTHGHSFRYYGTKWNVSDPHYGGEKYVNGNRHSPVKFKDARELMGNCKFVFAFENIHDELYSVNYLTEKIFHGFLSASVPIYAGAMNVKELLPDDIYINAMDFGLSVPKIVAHCEAMPDSEYNGYLDRIEEWLNGRGQEVSYNHQFVALDKKLRKVFG